MNGVVYSHFERWYKKCRTSIILPVEIICSDSPVDENAKGASSPELDKACSSALSVTHVNIVFSNGLKVRYHNLSYQLLYAIFAFMFKNRQSMNKINSLTTIINQFKEFYSLLKFSMVASEKRNESLRSQVTCLPDIICTLTDEIRGLREEVSMQSDYPRHHNKMSYGKKSFSSRIRQENRKSRE